MKKKLAREAKLLVKLSLNNDGFVDTSKVHAIVARLLQASRTDRLQLLRAYKHALKIALAMQTAVIESALQLDEDQIQAIRTSLETKVGRKLQIETSINPKLISGIRVTHFDTIYDANLHNTFRQLKEIYG